MDSSYEAMNRCVNCDPNRWFPKEITRCPECHQRMRTRSHWSGSASKFAAYYGDVKVVVDFPLDYRCSVILTLPEEKTRQ